MIIYSVKQKIDIIAELRLFNGDFLPCVGDCIMRELRGLSGSNVNASVALTLFNGLPSLSGEGKGDECILDICKRESAGLLSNDRNLLERAKELNIKTLTLRDKRRIIWY